MRRFILRIYNRKNFSKIFDHAGLDHDKNEEYLKCLCSEARKYNFKMVAINSVHTAYCDILLKDTEIGIGAAISYPLGQTTIKVKTFEAMDAINNGATEIDYVVNISEVKNKNWEYITEEMDRIVSVCRKASVTSKVIFENTVLKNEEIIQLAKIAKKIKPDFIKTSTGKALSGAKVEDVKLMKEIVGDDVKVKAAGGIRSFGEVYQMLEAGAERIGTSQSIKIMTEFEEYLRKYNIDEMVIR